MSAERAYQMGMVNRLFAREGLEAGTYALAAAIAKQPRMGLALTKQAINHVEDLQGKRTAMDAVFAWHHFAHSHNELLSGDKLGGYDARGRTGGGLAPPHFLPVFPFLPALSCIHPRPPAA